MSIKTDPMKPTVSRELAIYFAIIAGVGATMLAAGVLFGLLPSAAWGAGMDAPAPFNFHAFSALIEKAHNLAKPDQLYLDGNPVQRLLELINFIGAWLFYPVGFVKCAARVTTELDMTFQLPLLLLGSCCAGVAAALPIYGHVLSRTPALRSAVQSSGPEIFWFGAALRKARGYLSALVKAHPGGIELAPGLRLPRKAESESLFMIGLPGAGKSVIVEGLTRQAIERGDRVLALDAKGGLGGRIAALFGRNTRVVLGVGDDCTIWSIGRDIRDSKTAARIPPRFIPESRDPIWSTASRLVLKGLFLNLMNTRGSDWGWRELQAAISQPVEDIARDLRPIMRQVAEMLRDKGEDPTTMALSVIFNMVAHVSEIVDHFAALETRGNSTFSLFDWAHGRTLRRIVVLQHDLSDRENSELLLSTLLSVLAGELLSPRVKDNVDHGVWIFADELPRFSGAVADVATVASMGRSRGIRVVGCAQSFSQLEQVLTRAGADALTENFGTLIVGKARVGRNATEIANAFIGVGTYKVPTGGKESGFDYPKEPVLSPDQLTSCLGLTVDWLGAKTIRAAIIGLDHVYVVEWPLAKWKRL